MPSIPQPSGSPDTEALGVIRGELQRAENEGDVAAIGRLLADDVVMLVPDFPVQEGRTACVAFLDGLLPGLLEHFDRRITYTSDEVTVDGTMSTDRGLFSFAVRPKAGGSEEVVTGKYFWQYRQDDSGTWKLVRIVVTRDEADEGAPAPSGASRFAAAVALPFAVMLGLGEIARNWGDWGFWPFWIVDYVAVGLLLVAWRAARSRHDAAPQFLAGAWGFVAAMFYSSFFLELQSDLAAHRGLIGPVVLLWAKGGLLLVALAAFVASLRTAAGRRT